VPAGELCHFVHGGPKCYMNVLSGLCIAIRARGIQCSQQIRPPMRVSAMFTDARPLPSPDPHTRRSVKVGTSLG
jgi:hypothetical protein